MRKFNHGFFLEMSVLSQRVLIQSDRKRVGIFLLLAIVAVSMPYIIGVGIAAFIALTALFMSGVSFRFIVTRTVLILPFGAGAAIFLWLTGEADSGIRAGSLILKMLAANWCLSFIGATTPAPMLLHILRGWGLPHLLIEMITVTIRYMFVLLEEARDMAIAQRARGFRGSSLFRIAAYKRYGQLLGALLVRSLERSERIHHAMRARGYGIEFNPAERMKSDVSATKCD